MIGLQRVPSHQAIKYALADEKHPCRHETMYSGLYLHVVAAAPSTPSLGMTWAWRISSHATTHGHTTSCARPSDIAKAATWQVMTK